MPMSHKVHKFYSTICKEINGAGPKNKEFILKCDTKITPEINKEKYYSYNISFLTFL